MRAIDRTGGYLPIGDYSLIGDCRSAALVGVDGSIDWCCLPRFDSPSVFGRILDARRGGYWQLRPRGAYRSQQRYGDRTNVLRTIFSTPTGLVRVSDFMPVDEATVEHHARPHRRPRLVRIVDCLAGTVTMEHHLVPRPDYGRAGSDFAAEGRRFHGDADGLHLCVVSTTEMSGRAHTFTLSAGDAVAVSLRCQHASGGCCHLGDRLDGRSGPAVCSARPRSSGGAGSIGSATPATFRSRCGGRRSALKLMIYAPTGAIVAAPTTSLPETLGGRRNWDYRFTWLRDASLTLFGLFQLGLHDEAHEFFAWLRSTGIGEGAKVQNLYRVDGGRDMTEQMLGHLGRLPRLEAGADRQRCRRPAPARRLRRAAGQRLPLCALRRRDQPGALDGACTRSSTWPSSGGSSPTPRSGRAAAGSSITRTAR